MTNSGILHHCRNYGIKVKTKTGPKPTADGRMMVSTWHIITPDTIQQIIDNVEASVSHRYIVKRDLLRDLYKELKYRQMIKRINDVPEAR